MYFKWGKIIIYLLKIVELKSTDKILLTTEKIFSHKYSPIIFFFTFLLSTALIGSAGLLDL